MTQEEKANAYDEALDRAKSFQQKFGGDYAGYIFPELAESEDERIRKAIIANYKCDYHIPVFNGVTREDCIAYLEKRNEQKPSDEQLLKEAVEGRIHAIGFHNAIYIKEPEWTEMLDKYGEGDEILVIVLPKEDQNNG